MNDVKLPRDEYNVTWHAVINQKTHLNSLTYFDVNVRS